MSDTQEKLEEIWNCEDGYFSSKAGFNKMIEETITLIDSAKREAQIKMLKNMKKSLMVARVNPGLKPLQMPEDARIQQVIADEFDRNIAQLEQSEESI